MPPVTIQHYDRNRQSVAAAVEKSNAFARLTPGANVIIKPNIVVWLKRPYPQWGVITTSAVVEETVILLKDHGITDIAIVEGPLQIYPGNRSITQQAFSALGYDRLKTRYGVRLLDVWDRPFERKTLANGVSLRVNADLLSADFLVNLPVLKTHAQVTVSLGIKNLKGFLSIGARKTCHNADPDKTLNHMIAGLVSLMPDSATLIDGIYSLERGPSFEGKPRKTDLLIASADPVAADLVGARVLGHDPRTIPYLTEAADRAGIETDLSGIDLSGEPLDAVTSYHPHTFAYNSDNTLPLALEKAGIQGLRFHKFDDTLCTYCSPLIGMLLTVIGMSYTGTPFDEVEFLTGKRRMPSSDVKKTILVGQCMCTAHKDVDGPQEMVRIPGCPADPKAAADALKGIGIDVAPGLLTDYDAAGTFMRERFKDQPAFDPSYYTID